VSVFSLFELVEYVHKKSDSIRSKKKLTITTTEVQAFEMKLVSNNKNKH
jgi:hypothetical protein